MEKKKLHKSSSSFIPPPPKKKLSTTIGGAMKALLVHEITVPEICIYFLTVLISEPKYAHKQAEMLPNF